MEEAEVEKEISAAKQDCSKHYGLITAALRAPSTQFVVYKVLSDP